MTPPFPRGAVQFKSQELLLLSNAPPPRCDKMRQTHPAPRGAVGLKSQGLLPRAFIPVRAQKNGATLLVRCSTVDIMCNQVITRLRYVLIPDGTSCHRS
jgi:hypothetical protein